MLTPNFSRWAAGAAILALAASSLVACGGGDDASTPTQIPTTVTVTPGQSTPSVGNTTSGTTGSGNLNYLVYSNTDLTTGTATAATAQILAVPNGSTFTTRITFPAAAPFASGLVIDDAHSGGPNWPTDITPADSLIKLSGGGPFNMSWPSGNGTGLLAQGNFFVFCANGPAAPTIAEQAARTGAQVAISGNFSPMDNVAVLYGKIFKRFDCAGITTTSFGDGQGHLTMNGDGLNLSEAQTVQAFSADGYAPTAGQTVKRRAYSIVTEGRTRYAIVALDNRGYPYASVLYQLED